MSESTFVTGGSGFIGKHLVRELIDGGDEVTILSRSASIDIEGADTVEGDVTDISSIPDMSGYDTVVHLAALTSVSDSIEHPKTYFETNTQGTLNVLERARIDGVDRFVYLSSASVYGNSEHLPIDEAHQTTPRHPYAASKLAGEHVVESYTHTYDMVGTTGRAFTVYGPGQQSDNLVPEIIAQATRGDEHIELGNLHTSRDFVHVSDVASALNTLKCTREEGYEVYNIGSGQESTVKEVAKRLRDDLRPDAEIRSHGGRDSSVEIRRMVADCEKLQSLGWSPQYDLKSGLRTICEDIHS